MVVAASVSLFLRLWRGTLLLSTKQSLLRTDYQLLLYNFRVTVVKMSSWRDPYQQNQSQQYQQPHQQQYQQPQQQHPHGQQPHIDQFSWSQNPQNNRRNVRKKSLLIGINYEGQAHALKGCRQDVRNMVRYESETLTHQHSTNSPAVPIPRQ